MPATKAALATLARDSGLSEEIAGSLWAILRERYSEPHRHYHTLDHVGSMLDLLARCEAVGETDRRAVAWAIWFHDVIYDPKSSTNEADSAALFRKDLKGHLTKAFIVRVEQLILATEPHSKLPNDEAGRLLADLDLLTLGADPKVYQQYAAAIRKEYAFVPASDYSRGRTQVMEGFLKRERIYNTPAFEHLEMPARANIQEELTQLQR